MRTTATAARICTLLCIGLSPLIGQGQDTGWRYRVEAFGEIGHGRLYSGNHKLGAGLDFGGGVGVRPFSGRLNGVGFEVRAAHLNTEEGEIATSQRTVKSSMVAVNAVYHFLGRSRAQPFVYGGIARTTMRYKTTCNICVYAGAPGPGVLEPIPQRWESRATKAGVTLGAGLKLMINPHLSIRPELAVLDTTAGSGSNLGWLRAMVGIGVHF